MPANNPSVLDRTSNVGVLTGWRVWSLGELIRLSNVAECPLLAQSGHIELHRTCPLLGVKRTWLLHCKCPLLTQSGH